MLYISWRTNRTSWCGLASLSFLARLDNFAQSSAGPAKGVRLTATRKRATDWAQKEGLPMHEVNALEKKSVEGLFRSVAREVRESACGKKRS